MTPEEIQLLFQTGGTRNSSTDGEDDESTLPAHEKARRVSALRGVLTTAQQHWLSGSLELDLVAEKLGDGSRDASWRIPIGESGLLDFFLGIIPVDGLRQPLKIHTLRLIGNSCADTDENRARVVAGNCLPSIARLLGDDSLLSFVIPVLFNICVDYEPAQLQASSAGIGPVLVGLISTARLVQCQAFLNIICKILGLLIAQEPESSLADPATPIYLLGLATNPASPVDAEDFSALVSVALSYLMFEKFQEELVNRGMTPSLLKACSDSHIRFDVSRLDREEEAQLKLVRSRFVQVLADISALPSFGSLYPLHSTVVQTFQTWLRSGGGFTNLETAACLALGNLSRSDESSIYFVHEVQIHQPLISLLSKPHSDAAMPTQLLHAVLSFLKNLAIPLANKPILGVLLDSPANILPRLWSTTDTQPQTQFAAVSLTRLLLLTCPANVKRLCAPLSPDPSSPAHDRSNLHVLAALFDRIDAEPTKLEAARAVAAVCRVLHSHPVLPILPDTWDGDAAAPHLLPTSPSSPSSTPGRLPPLTSTGTPSTPSATSAGTDPAAAAAASSPGQSRRARFYAEHLDIANSLTHLTTQKRFPALRSEAWFVFALMSRAADGAGVVVRALQPFEACRALVEAVSGRDMVDGTELVLPASPGGADAAEFMAGLRGAVLDGAGGGRGDGVGMVGIEGLGLEPQQVDAGQAASMAKVDRENGLVLIAEILKNYADFLPPFRRSVFEELLRTGGELVLVERLQDQG